MKERILNFLKHDRSYEGGVKLYNEIGQRLSLKRQLSNYPEHEMKGLLFEEFREMAGIPHLEFQHIMKTHVAPVVAKEAAPEVKAIIPPKPKRIRKKPTGKAQVKTTVKAPVKAAEKKSPAAAATKIPAKVKK